MLRSRGTTQWLKPVTVIYFLSLTNYIIFGTRVLENTPLCIYCMYVYMYWFEHFLLIYILILKRLKNITLL